MKGVGPLHACLPCCSRVEVCSSPLGARVCWHAKPILGKAGQLGAMAALAATVTAPMAPTTTMMVRGQPAGGGGLVLEFRLGLGVAVGLGSGYATKH